MLYVHLLCGKRNYNKCSCFKSQSSFFDCMSVTLTSLPVCVWVCVCVLTGLLRELQL